MKIKSQKDFWSGLMFMAVGIAFAWGSTNYNFGSSARPGPGYFPFGLAVLMALLGAFLFFESLFRGEWAAAGSALKHLVLPAVALATIPLAVITRMTRSAMLEELGKDYVTTARAKGLPERLVVGRHVRRNVLIPVVTITGLQLGTLLSGAVLTETVFSWPGMGTHLVPFVLVELAVLVEDGVGHP